MSRPLSLRCERGVALPVVLGCLMVLSLLAAGLLTTSTRSSEGSNESRASKRALGAAEAGLQTATYRLKRLEPAAGMCMTTPIQQGNATGEVAPAGGECTPSTPEPVAARASFQYWVTPAGAACGSLPGGPGPSSNDRCITSVGIVNPGRPDEVRRRIQSRVEVAPQQPFAIAGVVGTESVTLREDVAINNTNVGSNGPITLDGSEKKVEIKGAEARPYVPGPPGGQVIRTGNTTIDGGVVASESRYGLTNPDFAPSRADNDNGQLNYGGKNYYDAATRSFNIPADADYGLKDGVYNLCSWTMGKGSKLDMSPKNEFTKATVYLESPRSDPTCAAAGAKAGKFEAVGGSGGRDEVKMNNGQVDANIRVFVYGTQDDPPAGDTTAQDIVFQGKAHIDAVWFAPDSIFRASGDINMHGGAVARHILMYDKVKSELDVAFESITIPGPGLLTARAWFECRPEPTDPADPESGC